MSRIYGNEAFNRTVVDTDAPYGDHLHWDVSIKTWFKCGWALWQWLQPTSFLPLTNINAYQSLRSFVIGRKLSTKSRYEFHVEVDIEMCNYYVKRTFCCSSCQQIIIQLNFISTLDSYLKNIQVWKGVIKNNLQSCVHSGVRNELILKMHPN